MPDLNAKGNGPVNGPVRKVSPLFRNPINEEGEYLYLDQIASIRIFRQLPDAGNRSRRVPILDGDFEREDGSFFEIDPSTTREEDILAHFDMGDYYIEPIGHDGRVMPGGRVLPFAAARGSERGQRGGRGSRWSGRRNVSETAYDEEDDEQSVGFDPRMDPRSPQYDPRCDQRLASYNWREDPRFAHLSNNPTNNPGAFMGHAGTGPAADPTIAKLIEQQQELAKQLREQSDKRAEDAQKWAAFNDRRGVNGAAERDDLVATLREEIADMRRKSRDDIDELRRKSEEDLRAKTRELDDARREYSDKLRAAQDEHTAKRRELEESLRNRDNELRTKLDDARRRHEDEISEVKRRSRNETDEERDKRHKSIDDARAHVEKRFNDLERSSAEVRTRMERRIEELMKENIDLRRDLADTPPPSDSPAPLGSTSHPDTPWWGDGLMKAAAPVGQAFADIAKAAVADAQKKKTEEEAEKKREQQRQAQQNGPPPSPTLPSQQQAAPPPQQPNGTSRAQPAQSQPQPEPRVQQQAASPPPPPPPPPSPPSPRQQASTPVQAQQPAPAHIQDHHDPSEEPMSLDGMNFSLGASITLETIAPLSTPETIVIDETIPQSAAGPAEIPDESGDDDFADDEDGYDEDNELASPS